MACTNPQNPSCPNCNKSGLAILPVRYAVVPSDVKATLPAPLGNKVSNVKLAHHKYALRTLREGYVYLFHEKNPRGSHIKWEVYSVSPDGTLWKQLSINAIKSVSADQVCSRSGHNIPASIIAIEKPEKCGKVWMAFSEHAWSEDTFKLFESDAKLRDKRMQTFLPATWIKAKDYRHGLEGTQANVEQVIEYHNGFSAASLTGGTLTDISEADGKHKPDNLKKQTTRYPLHMRKDQSKQVAEVMKKTGEQADSNDNPPIIMALWDAVGITHELNGFRNDAAGWIEKYGQERELEITAMNAIEGVKKALEGKAEDNEKQRQQDTVKHAPQIGSTQERRANAAKLSEPQRSQQIEACNILDGWEQRQLPSTLGYSMRLNAANTLPEPKRSAEIAKVRADAEEFLSRRAKNSPEQIAKAKATAWPKYADKLNEPAYEKFKKEYDAFLTAADRLIDARTDDLIPWLESKNLLNALAEYHPNNMGDGVAFEDAVGDMVFGISSSKKGAYKIDAWVKEAKATESNLLWRAIAVNQEEGIIELNAALVTATSCTGVPFTEAAYNAARDSMKHIAKIADLGKKAVSLHNTLRKDGIIRVPTGGIEKIFMTVGDRFFQPFIKKGADFLSEKFIQSLLLARAGCEYNKIMGLMLAEAKFGAIGRTETLLAMSMGHAIADKNASAGFNSLKDAWAKLIPIADTPKINIDQKLAGGFNEAKELRFAMVATLLQVVFAWKLAQDAEKDPNNKKIQAELLAAQLSFGAGAVDLGATAIKSLSTAKDVALSFQGLKLAGGIFSGIAAWVSVGLDFNAAEKAEHHQNYRVADLYTAKGYFNIAAGASSTLATLSYAKPAMDMVAKRFSSSLVARGFAYGFGRLFAWRAILMLGGMAFSLIVIGIHGVIWIFSDDELQNWCKRSAFGKDKKNTFTRAEIQMKEFKVALTEVM